MEEQDEGTYVHLAINTTPSQPHTVIITITSNAASSYQHTSRSGYHSICIMTSTKDVNASAKEIDECQFHRWFLTFEKSTMKSVIIKLPEHFISYLLKDGIVLPSSESSAFGYDELSDDDDLTEKVEGAPVTREDFTTLSAEIKDAIYHLNGEVFAKFNWSAPTDAAWLRGGSLKCTDSADVYLLLKSSDRIVFDIENMYNLCSGCDKKNPDEYLLILRKWANLDPAMEFRVFVSGDNIVGISQRDCASYYDHLANDKEDIEDGIVEFWESKVYGKFPLDKYTMDVYIDRKKRVWIVDFNPFGEPSSALLFEWAELLLLSPTRADLTDAGSCAEEILTELKDRPHNTEIDFEFRIINHQRETFSSTSGTYRGPIDVTLAPDFYKFMEICKNQDKEEAAESRDVHVL